MTDTYLDDERVQDWRDRRRPQRQVKASPPKLDIPPPRPRSTRILLVS
jgi:hypothetical protein